MAALCALRLPEGYKTLNESRSIDIIDCLQLPHTIEWHRIRSTEEAFEAIKSMKIRGAPAIASLAAVSIACELMNLLDNSGSSSSSSSSSPLADEASLKAWLDERCTYLLSSRPTAVNLREAMHRLQAIASDTHSAAGDDVRSRAQRLVDAGELVWTEDVERNVRIGDNGASWLLQKLQREGAIVGGERINVLTVCNTGSLATSVRILSPDHVIASFRDLPPSRAESGALCSCHQGYGTALGVISSLFRMGRLNHAFYAQTGPYQQGARLTSLELQSQGIPSTMVCDTMMASLLAGNSHGRNVHAFILGADRIAANGDTANKISSYQISLLAGHVPPPKGKQRARVLVCAPVATFDLTMDSGEHIEIEERPNWEACTVRGKIFKAAAPSASGSNGKAVRAATSEATQLGAQQANQAGSNSGDVVTVLVTPEGTQAWNPAFDVTPAALIDGVASELGVAEKADGDAGFDLRTFVKQGGKARGPTLPEREWQEADAAGGANGVRVDR